MKIVAPIIASTTPPPLALDCKLATEWLVAFLRAEFGRRGFDRAIVGMSGGVDSAVTGYLCARALGAENVIAVRMPYRTSSPQSLEHAKLVTDALGVIERTVDISAAVDGYVQNEPDASAARRGNVMARMRMIVLFDLSAKHHALPVGTGNKTERLFGYFTWHADDAPPINPLGDLFKTQVWELARFLGVPDVIVNKPASADLIKGQTDEHDFGIAYDKADEILNWLLTGYNREEIIAHGFSAADVETVRHRLGSTHWKRRLPTVAMLSPTAIGESYLRPVEYSPSGTGYPTQATFNEAGYSSRASQRLRRDARGFGQHRGADEECVLGGVVRRGVRGDDTAAWLARTYAHEAARNCLHVLREILAAHVGGTEGNESVRTEDARDSFACPRRGARWIDDGRSAAAKRDRGGEPIRRRNRFGDAAHLAREQRARFAGSRTDGPAQLHAVGDDVGCRAGVDGADRHHARLRRIQPA
jgi:NAD+ synthetase